jgi:hypothetical protein
VFSVLFTNIKKIGAPRAGLLRSAVLIAAFLVLGATNAHATLISGLFTTGVDGSGNALPGNTLDPHYTLISSDDVNFPPTAAKTVISPIPAPWQVNANNTPIATWISANPVQTGEGAGQTGLAAGTYIYRLTFTLAANQNPALASITGNWAADDLSMIFLNGVYVPGLTNLSGLFGAPQLQPFNIPSGGNQNLFVPGENHLDFIVVNQAFGTSGLMVSDITGNAPLIPEPSTVVLSLIGGLGLGYSAWRRRR